MVTFISRNLLCFIVISIAISCTNRDKQELFRELSESETGIEFTNRLSFDERFNIFTYRNFYNGGGVAIGDINNDGLSDIYFTSNMEGNRLYLNKGAFKFEDITESAGVSGKQAWSTGVSMADVNGDGWLDIYVCNSGDIAGDNKRNELFINNKDLTFSERAREYSVDDAGYSTHAAFFDYDKDGDLDLYILNNSYQPVGNFNLRKEERSKRDPLGGDKLLRNNNGKFSDASVQAGIYGSVIGFGLGVTAGDVNHDGWTDIYVSNDFFERDYLYINNRNGTFTEQLTSSMKSISNSSMGADLADINNDAWPDFFVTEMLPGAHDRFKSVTTFLNWDTYQYRIENGYHHQFTRNSLQLNNRDLSFSEIGRLAGVEATDWSWGALIFDMNNDGLKDIFVANGIFKDLTDQDYLQYISHGEIVKSMMEKRTVNYEELIDAMPSNPVPNHAFQNEGNFRFTDKANEWGLSAPSFSNGSAYGDLDNDGDLDLVVNNVNMPSVIYENKSEQVYPENRYLKFSLKGGQANTSAIGARITIEDGDRQFYLEQMPVRGFQSSVDPALSIGLGKTDTVDRVTVRWPYGGVSVLEKVSTNQTLYLNEQEARYTMASAFKNDSLRMLLSFNDVTRQTEIDYRHIENDFVDFDRDHLIFHMLSSEGPPICTGDVDGNGLDDFFVGGASDSPGALFVQYVPGKFRRTNEDLFEQDILSEDTDCVFFDADHDGDADLLVASGGSEFAEGDAALADRLYLNDGRGNFLKSDGAIPALNRSTSCVRVSDYDQDGDIDLFVGERLRPFAYGMPVSGRILNNDGRGRFSDITDRIATTMKNIGMVTDAQWADVDGDGDEDLLVSGEWMSLKLFINQRGRFEDKTLESRLEETHGWWNTIEKGDLDNDGDIDFVAGNHGLNSRFKGSLEKPANMYVNDFDGNGSIEQIITTFDGDKAYPMVLRHDLVIQIQSLKKKYLKYEAYKDQTIEDIFSKRELKNAVVLKSYEFQNSVILNNGNGTFTVLHLPVEAQVSPVYAIHIEDLNNDGFADALLGGNFYRAKPETGRYDASQGLLMLGDGTGFFEPIHPAYSGWKIEGEIRDIAGLSGGNTKFFLVARNNDSLKVFSMPKNTEISSNK